MSRREQRGSTTQMDSLSGTDRFYSAAWDRVELRSQSWQIILNNRPYDIEVNRKVALNQAVTSNCYFMPGYLWMYFRRSGTYGSASTMISSKRTSTSASISFETRSDRDFPSENAMAFSAASSILKMRWLSRFFIENQRFPLNVNPHLSAQENWRIKVNCTAQNSSQFFLQCEEFLPRRLSRFKLNQHIDIAYAAKILASD